MPDMRVQGSSSSYSPTYFQSLTKNSKNGETSDSQKTSTVIGHNKLNENDPKNNSTSGLSGEEPIKSVQKKEDKSGNKTEVSEADQTTIQRMKAIENEVIAHEQAHKSAGGSIAGPASYTYATGPDGKRYISGGEVSLRTPATDDKERKVKLLDRVKQAALAPAQPSPQDIRVAAGATSEQLQLNAAIQREKALKAYGGDKTEQGAEKEKPVETGAVGEKKKNEKGRGQYFDQVG